jgi:diphthine synthase
MLWLIGIGIHGYKGISIHALDILKRCDIVYIERFTSALSDDDLQGLNSLIGKNDNSIIPVERWFVEDGREILEKANNKEIALLAYGDPLIATTLTELHVRAVKKSIKVNIIHAASGITSLIGETGLHIYKFGRTVTMMSEPQSTVSVYNTIFDNLLAGNHTLILTEYNNKHNNFFFLDPIYIFKMLMETEKDLNHKAFSEETFIIIASRVGTRQKKIISGKVKSLNGLDFGTGPHSIIITGLLHFTESDALTTLTYNVDKPTDNTLNIQKISVSMVQRYVPNAKHAVEQMKSIIREENKNLSCNKGSFEVLDNAEYYIDDAERFLRQGKLELAVLSIGYAEGLIDALRFQKGISP